MSSVIDPSSDAFFFTITSASQQKYDAFIDVNKIGEDYYFDCRYRRINNASLPWTFLSMGNNFSAQFDLDKMTTTESTLAMVDKMLERCNMRISEVFGEASATIPTSGIELVIYLFGNGGIVANNNVLSRK